MPIEDRRIIFNPDELYHAIYAHCKRSEKKVPPQGKITSVLFKDETHDIIDVQVSNSIENEESIQKYSNAFIAAALIMYCRGTGIPVPKSAEKSIDIVKNRVVLRSLM